MTPGPVENRLQLNKSTRTNVIVVVFSLLCTCAALYLVPDNLEHWHYILQRLFYFPIILAGLKFGWRAGGAAGFGSAFAYTLRQSPSDPADAIDRYLEALMFCLIGVITGVLSDQGRRHQASLQATAFELQTAHRELGNKVEQLNRASRMSALGQLSAGLAHEIRNPLASIEGAAFIAQTEPDDSRRTEFMEIISKETKRLNGLLTHFLEFARPRPPQLTLIDARTLIESVLALVGRIATQGEIKIQTKFDSDNLLVECDSEQIKQVLLNLILNSVQAMPQGGEIELSGAKDRNEIVLRVRDSGPGIPAQDLDQIFNPFFTTKQSGTGLGLPIAYQIIEGHGGRLSLEANSADGCCFTIRLPMRQ